MLCEVLSISLLSIVMSYIEDRQVRSVFDILLRVTAEES
jgi:hypothetical protein